MKRLGVSVVIGIGMLSAGCSGSSVPTAPVVPTSVATSADGASIGHVAALKRGSLRAATLDVASGATSVNVKVGNLSGKLMTVVTPSTSGQQPALALTSPGVVTLQLTSATSGGGGGPSVVNVVLDSSVTWTLDLEGGATDERVDMRGGRLALLDFAAGVTHATVDLSARSGTQVVREVGGASELTVAAPAKVATRVRVRGGAGSVQIGAATHSGIGGNRTFTDPGYASAADRLDLDLQGGVSSVTVRRA